LKLKGTFINQVSVCHSARIDDSVRFIIILSVIIITRLIQSRPISLRLFNVLMFVFFRRLSHQHCFIPPFIIDPAEEVITSLMNSFYLIHREIEVDAQNHHFILLYAHDNGENDEA
jgi:hypothetical protein